MGFFLSNPTIIRHVYERESWDGVGSMGVFSLLVHGIGGPFLYSHLFQTNPKFGAILLGTHITTNLASGIYEYVRHVKKRSEERIQLPKL